MYLTSVSFCDQNRRRIPKGVSDFKTTSRHVWFYSTDTVEDVWPKTHRFQHNHEDGATFLQWRLDQKWSDCSMRNLVMSVATQCLLFIPLKELIVCHRNINLENVITNCSYMWNYSINRVIKSGTHYLLSRYQDTRDNIEAFRYAER
jgi:hypothetical protein